MRALTNTGPKMRAVKRHSVKRDRVVADLTRRIASGELAPGCQLPLREILLRRFAITSGTLQQAFDSLKQDGFVESRGRWGTFVAKYPPCFYNYALVFPNHPSDSPGWSLFWQAIADVAGDIERATDRHLPLYYDVRGSLENPSSLKLLADIQARRLAGVIFVNSPAEFIGTPLLANDGVPRVCIMGGSNAFFPHVPAVYPDLQGFLVSAIALLAERGRKRVAMMMSSGEGSRWRETFETHVREHGMETHGEWIQPVHIGGCECATSLIQLLMSPLQRERPDALILTDDHFVPHVTAGLLKSGVDVPKELEVVAEANFPQRGKDHLPITHLGFSAEELLHTCVARLESLRQGEAVPPLSLVPPIRKEVWNDRLPQGH